MKSIITQNYEDAFVFTNSKLKNIKTYVGKDRNMRIKSYWYEQGEELGKLTHGFSNVLFMSNRPMQMTSDVDYYSIMATNSSLKNKIGSYVKARDIVGILN